MISGVSRSASSILRWASECVSVSSAWKISASMPFRHMNTYQRPHPGAGMSRLASAISKMGFSTNFTVNKLAGMQQHVKPEIEHHIVMKDGRNAIIRRVRADDFEMLLDFHGRAEPWSMFDYLASSVTMECVIKDMIVLGTHPGDDALIAIVDGQIEGYCEYESQPGEMEYRIDPVMLHAAELSASDVCVAKAMITRGAQGSGLGIALKRAQMQSAKDAGYKAIVSKTSAGNAAVLQIVKKMGGVVGTSEPANPWTLIPLK
jgi:hypothetical protein